MPKEPAHAACTWDFTSFNCDLDGCKTFLTDNCKKWAFQKEACPDTGREHFQGRFSLKQKVRKTGLIKLLAEGWDPNAHVSMTSVANRDNQFYVMKDSSRVEGPWTDRDFQPPPLPKQACCISEETLMPWQRSLMELANTFDSRKIYIVREPIGGCGKSTFATWLACTGKARRLPPFEDPKAMMRMVYSCEAAWYILDLPRTCKNLPALWPAIESVKDGYAYDDRYSWKERYFDSPFITIFTNQEVNRAALSADRWVFTTIENNELAFN